MRGEGHVATRFVQNGHAPVSMRVPFAPSSVSTVRTRFRDWLHSVGVPHETVEDARVVLSELVGNSVRHAQPLSDGTLLVKWHRGDDGIVLSVTDGGAPTQPRTLQASASALAGRGMAIVETLASKWWVEHTHSRCTVHALLAAV